MYTETEIIDTIAAGESVDPTIEYNIPAITTDLNSIDWEVLDPAEHHDVFWKVVWDHMRPTAHILADLEAAATAVTGAEQALETAVEARDHLVRVAWGTDASKVRVAEAAGVTRARVYQIVSE